MPIIILNFAKMQIIGTISSCYTEKFGIPRQPGLVTAARCHIEFQREFANDDAFIELENFSHLWILFLFHAAEQKKWHPTVRPPKLGGNRRVGVFASRSPFRPNSIGMSVVKNGGLERKKSSLILHIEGGDFLNGTPVIDIKPYLRASDCIPEATMGYAESTWQCPELPVVFSSLADQQTEALPSSRYPEIKRLIEQVLAQDPRPGYIEEERTFALQLYDLNITWHIDNGLVIVDSVLPR